MYKYLIKSMEVILKALLDTSKYMYLILIFTIGCKIENVSSKELNNIFLYCIATYIIINVIVTKLLKYNLNKYFKIFISVAIIAVSVVLPIKVINKTWDMYTFFLSINFTLISLKSILYANDGLEREQELKNFTISLGLLMFSFMIVWILRAQVPEVYIQCIKKYLAIYFLMGVIGVTRLHLVEEYKKSNSIFVNKDKNILRVNIISILIITVSLTLVSMEQLINFLSVVFFRIHYYSVKFFGYILNGLFGNSADNLKNDLANRTAKPIKGDEPLTILGVGYKRFEEFTEEMRDYIPQQVKKINTIPLKILTGIVVIIFILCIVYVIYKKLNFKPKVKEKIADEEKDFIFSLNDLKDPFKKLSDSIQEFLNNKKIHPIRKIYIQSILKLNETSFKYKKWYTPNEYSKIIENNYEDKKEFGTITQYYNELRYGNKKITDEKINKAQNIVNKL